MKAPLLATAALALTALFTQAAMAKDLDLSACSKDGKTVTMKVEVQGALEGGDIDAVVRNTFRSTAAGMSAKAFATEAGVNKFIDNAGGAVMLESMNGHQMVGGFGMSGKIPTITEQACKVQPR